MKNTGIPSCPWVTLNTPQYEVRSGFKPLCSCVHVGRRHHALHPDCRADCAADDTTFSRIITRCMHLFSATVSIFCQYVSSRSSCFALPRARAVPSVMQHSKPHERKVTARYESPTSINNLYLTPRQKHPHLPGAARGDEAGLPGGRLACLIAQEAAPFAITGIEEGCCNC